MGHRFLRIVAVNSAAVVVVVVEVVKVKEEQKGERELKGEAVTVTLSTISECPLTV